MPCLGQSGLPFVFGGDEMAVSGHAHHGTAGAAQAGPLLEAGISNLDALATTALVHTLGYLVVTGALAVVVYEWVGLRILRRAWINLNLVWAAALIAAAAVAIPR